MLVGLYLVFFAAAIGFGFLAWRTRREEQLRSEARVAALAMAVDGDVASAPSEQAMFTRSRHAGVRRHPIVSAAAGIAVTVALVVGVAMATRESVNTTAGIEAESQLELLAMRDARLDGTLTISGLVRNGRRGGEVHRVTAVVLAFGDDGTFIASARAPIEIQRLRPGEQSPFVVSVPGVANVQRYRVTFRDGRGVVRHLDLRRKA